MWKPSTVEDIRAWFAGEYVLNPTAEEFDAALLQRLRQARLDGTMASRCLIPENHPARNPR